MALDLSLLIPSRNEMFLARTIEDALANIEADTEIIAVLDGYWPAPPIPQNDRVNIIHLEESIGQRAATNLAAKLSRAKYVMKVDAHCSFDKGFDRKMLEGFQKTGDNVTMVPVMRNLWAFDWKCMTCGKKWYQGPTPTKCRETNFRNTGKDCPGTRFTRKIMWIGKNNPQSTSYCFDASPHFQYFEDWKHREPYLTDKKTGFTETMSLQGSCWMLTREKYWDLNVCDEGFGSWGSQGIEVAVKTWLSGAKVLVNHSTWYAHMFRTQGGDFSFPYKISTYDQKKAQEYAKNLFYGNKWEKQIHPLSWLVEKFWPVKGWTEEDLMKLKENKFEFKVGDKITKTEEQEPESVSVQVPKSEPKVEAEVDQGTEGQLKTPSEAPKVSLGLSSSSKAIIYLSDSLLDERLSLLVKDQLQKISKEKNIPIISSTLKKTHFGTKNIFFPSLSKGYYTLFLQILRALENCDSEIVFICSHDILYHPTHFDFVPRRKLAFYYNTNIWRVSNSHALKVNDFKTLGSLCCHRKTLLAHYKKRINLIKKSFEKKIKGRTVINEITIERYLISDPGVERYTNNIDRNALRTWVSAFPNIDIKHDGDFLETKWLKSDYPDKKEIKGWTEATADTISGWENLGITLSEVSSPQATIFLQDDSTLFDLINS